MRLPVEGRSKLGAELKRLRKLRHLTQEQLEEKAGVGQSTISALENGRQDQTSLEYIKRLADALAVPRNTLLAAAEILDEAEEVFAPVQLRLGDPDELFDPEVIVDYIESLPGEAFQSRLRRQRERRARASYVNFCVGLFRSLNMTADFALSQAEEAEQGV